MNTKLGQHMTINIKYLWLADRHSAICHFSAKQMPPHKTDWLKEGMRCCFLGYQKATPEGYAISLLGYQKAYNIYVMKIT